MNKQRRGDQKMDQESKNEKPHAVMVPLPTQGHINPCLKLAKLLHSKGFHITFVNSEFSHKRWLKSKGPNTLDNLPGFQFETIPDGLPPDDPRQDIVGLVVSAEKTSLQPFKKLLSRLNDPPVTCIITNNPMSFTLHASDELGIPNVFFWPNSACGFLGFKLCVDLRERGVIPFKDQSYLTDGTLDAMVEWYPGLKDICLKDVPGFVRTTDPNDRMLNEISTMFERTQKSSAVILHTFDALEHDVLEAMPSIFSPVYAIGPLPLLVDQVSDEGLKSIDCNLWKQEDECIQWLDSMEKGSVVYVNFGSVVKVEQHHIVELAWGLVNSKQKFLWVIRPDLVMGSSAILPPELVDEIRERGKIASWCAQEKVLNHPAVGGFMTHCGWNSTIESITAGVPMLCLPFVSDQLTNCKFLTSEWGIGLEFDINKKRDEIGKLVRELIVGEKAKRMKDRAMEWKARAMEATAPGGSSFRNLENLVNQVLRSRK